MHHPYLGVEFDGKLGWGIHIDNITKRATNSLNLVRFSLFHT